MSKIKLGTSAIYFYGVISYRDAFSRRRKTQFRYQHGGARLFGTEDLALSPQGNKATNFSSVVNKRSPAGVAGFFRISMHGVAAGRPPLVVRHLQGRDYGNERSPAGGSGASS